MSGLGLWRRLGADPPFGDPRGAHGVPMEGYYWRLADPASGRVIVALCGVTRWAGVERARVAIALHPEGRIVTQDLASVWLDPTTLGIDAGESFRASPGSLNVHLDSVSLEATFAGPGWPRRGLGGLGLAGAIPGLSQYWHPHLLGATTEATLTVDGPTEHLDVLTYAEKNWGRGFPRRWWWGEAHTDDVGVAFAGGTLQFGRLAVPATAVVARVSDRVIRFVAPSSLVRFQTAPGEWRVTARSIRKALTIEGDAGGSDPFILPLPPSPDDRATESVEQYPTATLRVHLRHGRRRILSSELSPAGLEFGGRQS